MADDKTQMYQCVLRQGTKRLTAWIEARGAKKGATVELLPSKEDWEVLEVFEHGMPSGVLQETKRLNRKSLPSIDPMS